jgi:hypothetical protein
VFNTKIKIPTFENDDKDVVEEDYEEIVYMHNDPNRLENDNFSYFKSRNKTSERDYSSDDIFESNRNEDLHAPDYFSLKNPYPPMEKDLPTIKATFSPRFWKVYLLIIYIYF